MIKLFNSTDTLFSSNGDKVIIPTKAKIHKEDNGSFYLDLETNLDYINNLVQGKIIVAPTPQGEQAFRVGNVSKTRRKLSTRCYHVFYDTQNYLIEDSYVVDKNCNDALDHLNSATDNPSPFITISDIATIDSYRCVRKSLYEAIQTVIERWGGHLVRDNFTIKVMNTIGQDNGVTVRYAKNLKDITCEENWDAVVTKLLPVGKDGIMLPEVYLYSDTRYSIPYTRTVSFEQNDINEEDYKDKDGNTDEEAYQSALIKDLRAQATEYLKENCVPKVNYTLKANLEKISDVGDVVEVIDERLGIDINTNIISYDYDCILGKYTELEFGNFTQNLSNLISHITSSTTQQIQTNNNNLQATISQSIASATDTIWQTLGSSYVIYNGDKILVLDALPKENAKNVMMINAGGISFSQAGINGPFETAWTLDNKLNMQHINVINCGHVLYNNDSGTAETVTLSDSAENYTYLEIFYRSSGNNACGSVKVFSPNNKLVHLGTIHYVADYDYAKFALVSISGTSITFSQNYQITLKNNGSTYSSENAIFITRVVGY